MHLAELVEKLFAETKLKVYFRGKLFLTISFFFYFHPQSTFICLTRAIVFQPVYANICKHSELIYTFM